MKTENQLWKITAVKFQSDSGYLLIELTNRTTNEVAIWTGNGSRLYPALKDNVVYSPFKSPYDHSLAQTLPRVRE